MRNRVAIALLSLAACRRTPAATLSPGAPRIPTSTSAALAPDAAPAHRGDATTPASASPSAPDVAARDAQSADAPPAGPALSAGCQQLVAEGAAALARASGVLAGVGASTRERFEVFRRCFDSPNGSHWVLSLDRIERTTFPDPNPEIRLSGAFSLVHVDAAGQRVAFTPSITRCGQPERARESLHIGYANSDNTDGTRITDFTAYDWDHDGEAEVFLRVMQTEEGDEDFAPSGQRCGRIWTFRNAAISAYAPAGDARLEALRDVDGDGRPDAVTYGGYTGRYHYADTPAPHNDHTGPGIVMRALPDGSFSRTDPLAVAATRASCADIEGAAGYTLDLAGVACMRMRGQTPAQVQAHVRDACTGSGESDRDFCNSMSEIRRWIALPVPVSIAP